MIDDGKSIGDLFFEAVQEEINKEVIKEVINHLSNAPQLPTGAVTSPLSGSLAICRYEDGTFGVRGRGTDYVRFYKEEYHGRLFPFVVSVTDDWPWCYFTLSEDADIAGMLERWAPYVIDLYQYPTDIG